MSEIISIHAPPRGATSAWQLCRYVSRYFNSRPSARGDRIVAILPSNIHNFNSRPSARGDAKRKPSSRRKQFQFTPLREGRQIVETDCMLPIISIHAPPRGATEILKKIPRNQKNFNSRPSARGDLEAQDAQEEGRISIHAPPRGATSSVSTLPSRSLIISIHAPPRGATL